MDEPKCSVADCSETADFKVALYDFYSTGTLFLEQDRTCPFLCAEHAWENETKASGVRRPRGTVTYPYSNLGLAQGFTIYVPLDMELAGDK